MKRKTKPAPPDAVHITATQVLLRYGGRSHMFLERILKNDPTFPRPFKVGRLRFFTLSEIEAYERSKVAA